MSCGRPPGRSTSAALRGPGAPAAPTKKHGVATLNLAPALQRHSEQHGLFVHGFENTQLGSGHWNRVGHRLAAELIALKILETFPDLGG